MDCNHRSLLKGKEELKKQGKRTNPELFEAVKIVAVGKEKRNVPLNSSEDVEVLQNEKEK